jgi:hypothetical protein
MVAVQLNFRYNKMEPVTLTHPYPIDPKRVAAIVYFDPSINVALVEASLAIKLVALVPIVGVEPVAPQATLSLTLISDSRLLLLPMLLRQEFLLLDRATAFVPTYPGAN